MDGPIRVVHVDDDPELVDLTRKMLERADDRLAVTTRTRPEAVLSDLEDGQPDCIISDHDMPGMSGIELLRAVRDDHPDLPFILFTGKGSETVASEAVSAGVTEYMQKEAGTDQYTILANRVRNAVSQYRAQREASRTRRRLEELTNSLTDCLWMFDRDWEEVLFVSGYEEVWGRPAKALADDPLDFLAQVHPEDQDLVEDGMDRLSAGESVDIEYRIRRGDGETRWIWVKGEPVIEDGSVVRVVGFARDVTDRTERERTLEVRTRAMDEAPVGIVITDPDHEDNPIVYANDGFLELTGYDRDEVLGRNCRFLQGEETDEEHVDQMRRAIEAAEPVRADVRNYRADGEPFWNRVSIAPVRDETGTVTNFVGSQLDMTTQKERARELATVHDRMSFALEVTDSYVYEIDLETGEETRHGPFERLHGIAPEEVSTTEAFNALAVHPDDRERLARIQREIREERPAKPIDMEYRTNPEHGEVRWIRSEAYVQSSGSDESDTFVGLATDVTPLKRREHDLERQNERLDAFASVVSHDLRNPLNVAAGRLELARQNRDDEHLAAVDRSLGRMESLIGDLLTLAREGERAIDARNVDLTAVVEDCWEAIETDDTRLIVDSDLAFRADPGGLQQLLENLLRNCVEHGATSPGSDTRQDTPDHGTQGTESGDAGEASVTVTVGALAEEAGFYVSDDGPGIPVDEREAIFEPGYSTSQDGTGFGLDIVKEIAEAHGWSVRVTDSEAGGARFEITGVERVE